MGEPGGDGPDAAASGALPTQADSPAGRRRDASQPGPELAGTPSLSAFDPPPRRFEIRGEIGRGGMGLVEDAYDRALGRPVAIKRVLATSPVDLARFEREARITARLEHPGIVPVHDAGRGADGTPYYVMRHVDGRPLDELVDDRPLADRLSRVPNVLAVCDAVGYAHARGVVHRDIKPSNILVGPFGETLLIDWGLARETAAPDGGDGAVPLAFPSDPQLTYAGAVAGTPGFMAPEQARGEAVDARADVFALGATLFHVLAGRPPYASISATEMIDAVGRDRPPEWTRIPRGVPADLRAIVHKAMASRTADRYPDAGAMAADLRRFVTGKLVAAHAYGIREQLWRFVRRNRAPLAVAAVALLVLAIGGYASVRRIVDERDAADAARRMAEQRDRDTHALRDGLLVDHAKVLADTDPLSAIALLRDLDPDSAYWPQAYAAASEAFFRGIPSGVELDTAGISMFAPSPDGRHVIVTTFHGEVVELDLEARTRRELLTDWRFAFCDYALAGTRVLCRSRDDGVALIDPAAGTHQVLQTPVPVSFTTTDGAARAWLLSGHELYQLDLRHPEAGFGAPIAHEVTEVAYVPRARRLLIGHADRMDVVAEDGHTWAIPRAQLVAFVIQDGTRIVLAVADRYQVWELAAVPQLVADFGPAGRRVVVGLIDGTLYLDESGNVVARTPGGEASEVAARAMLFGPIADAFAVAREDGSIHVHDRDGGFELAPRPVRYTRVTLTPDRRFVVAGTERGVVMWWDLRLVRPRSIVLDEVERPVALGHWLWSIRGADKLTRRDLLSGVRSDTPVGPAATAFVEQEERYVAIPSPAHALVLDSASHRTTFDGDVTTPWVFGSLGLLETSGTQLVRVANGSDAPAPFATLPEGPLALATEGEHVLALTAAHACRLSGAAPLVCIPLPPAVVAGAAHITLDRAGHGWLVAEGKLYEWPPGAPAWRAHELEEKLTDLDLVDGRGVAFGGASLLVLSDPPRSISLPGLSEVFGAHDTIVYAITRLAISVCDLRSGGTYSVPLAKRSIALVTNGEYIVYQAALPRPDRAELEVVTLSVPREPAELRAWLDRITNARRTHEGIVSFP